MGRLTEDLARLRQNINSSRESRIRDDADRTAQEYIRASSVNTLIAGFASARANQAKVDAQARAAFVSENTNNLVSQLDRFSNEHQAVARQGREERASFVADVAKKTADLMAEYDAKHKEDSEAASRGRADFIANLGHEVAGLLENFNSTRSAQSREAAHERAEFFGDLARSISRFLVETKSVRANNAKLSSEERKSFIASLASQVSSQLESINQARAQMNKSTKEEREAFVSNLASTVASLINESASDRAGANAAFFGGVGAEKKKENLTVAVHQAEPVVAKPADQERSGVQIEAIKEATNSEEKGIQPLGEVSEVVETVQGEPEPVTLWDSLVVKKVKSGDHEKPRKKHQAAAEDNSENKPNES